MLYNFVILCWSSCSKTITSFSSCNLYNTHCPRFVWFVGYHFIGYTTITRVIIIDAVVEIGDRNVIIRAIIITRLHIECTGL